MATCILRSQDLSTTYRASIFSETPGSRPHTETFILGPVVLNLLRSPVLRDLWSPELTWICVFIRSVGEAMNWPIPRRRKIWTSGRFLGGGIFPKYLLGKISGKNTLNFSLTETQGCRNYRVCPWTICLGGSHCTFRPHMLHPLMDQWSDRSLLGF